MNAAEFLYAQPLAIQGFIHGVFQTKADYPDVDEKAVIKRCLGLQYTDDSTPGESGHRGRDRSFRLSANRRHH